MGSPREIAEKMTGFCPNVATAANPDAAFYAARGFQGITVIPPGREAEALAPLPLSLLTEDPRILETFDRWGLRTFRDLAALPEIGLAERFGPEGVRLWKLARGEQMRPLRIGKPDENFEESLELEHPLTLLEPLSFLLSRQLNDICARLNAHGLSAGEVHLTLNAETRTYRPPVPMRDARTFLKLMQLDLQGMPPREPVTRVAIKADPTDPRSVQSGLFLPPAPEPEKLEITVARIANIVGKENVGVPRILDTHRPDAFQILPTRYLAANERESTRIQNDKNIGVHSRSFAANILSFRVSRPPAPLNLSRIHRRVARTAGPWRTSGDWWTGEPWDRDEYDIAMIDGTLYRVFRDNRTQLWFFEGAYD
jgi:protein ImuB